MLPVRSSLIEPLFHHSVGNALHVLRMFKTPLLLSSYYPPHTQQVKHYMCCMCNMWASFVINYVASWNLLTESFVWSQEIV